MENKYCEKCGKEIPQDYINLLCGGCYAILESENAKRVSAESVAQPDGFRLTEEGYRENEEVGEIDMVSRVHGRFKGIGIVMPVEQRQIYTRIKDYFRTEFVMKNAAYPKFIWKPKVADVGCGLGIGSNILSQEADYVLGLDKNEENVRYAKQMFSRERNNIYYSCQVDFMESDVYTENRELMKFDIVTCIEVFEHLKDPIPLINFIKKLLKPDGKVFISTPNRNAEKIQKDTPFNPHHVRETKSEIFETFLKQHFKNVQLMDSALRPVEANTVETPIVALCS